MKVLAALLGSSAALLAAPALAAEPEVYARVTASEVELRSGPGVSHRVLLRAHRGETFAVRSRSGLGYWIEIELADGRTGYVLGDAVERVVLDEGEEGARAPGFFAPPALQEAHAGFTLSGGVFDRVGYAELKAAYVLAPSIAFEPYAGLSLRSETRRVVYGLAGTLNLAPDWAVAPFVTLGGGRLHQGNNASADFVRGESDHWHARVGGGFLISLRLRILVRLEATHTVVFTEDSYDSADAFVGGLGTYF